MSIRDVQIATYRVGMTAAGTEQHRHVLTGVYTKEPRYYLWCGYCVTCDEPLGEHRSEDAYARAYETHVAAAHIIGATALADSRLRRDATERVRVALRYGSTRTARRRIDPLLRALTIAPAASPDETAAAGYRIYAADRVCLPDWEALPEARRREWRQAARVLHACLADHHIYPPAAGGARRD